MIFDRNENRPVSVLLGAGSMGTAILRRVAAGTTILFGDITMPMCMFTALEKQDWKGKTVIPFCTNEGSGLGSSERDLKSICKGAKFKPGLSVHGAESEQSKNKVANWAKDSI